MNELRILLGVVLITFFFSACEKESTNSDIDYMSEIIGTYNGEFSNESGLKSSNYGTAEVSMVNDQIQIHCYGDIMDTTFMMDVFENGDSIMVCATGEAFEHEYGHMGNGGNHMMDMHSNQSEWQHHLSDDHNDGDMHYGGFNMAKHTFGYMFKMMDGDSKYYVMFNGTKN